MFCSWFTSSDHPMWRAYHDDEWGQPCHDDRLLFEYLVMECMSCGLSWGLMMRKREIFRQVFAGFDPARVARFTDARLVRALAADGMIKSRRKLEGMRGNARCYLEVQREFGSFDAYLWGFTAGRTVVYRENLAGGMATRSALSDLVAADMRRRGFRFFGTVLAYSYLQGVGVICDHDPDCPAGRRALRAANVLLCSLEDPPPPPPRSLPRLPPPPV